MSEDTMAKPVARVIPDLHPRSTSGVFNPHRTGLRYKEFLKKFSKFWAPRSYLEIGTSSGASLEFVACPSIAIDPQFKLTMQVVGEKPQLFMFQMTSDDFFAKYNPRSFFPEAGGLDLAFLDGMHHFEYLLRDFLNAERFANPGAAFFLHDCFPVTPTSAKRRENRKFSVETDLNVTQGKAGWAGDVWKVLRILLDYRPDLKIFPLDCPPTGLVLITGLSPQNTVLKDNYQDIVEKYMNIDAEPKWFDGWHGVNDMVSTGPLLDDALFADFVHWVRAHNETPPGRHLEAPPSLSGTVVHES